MFLSVCRAGRLQCCNKEKPSPLASQETKTLQKLSAVPLSLTRLWPRPLTGLGKALHGNGCVRPRLQGRRPFAAKGGEAVGQAAPGGLGARPARRLSSVRRLSARAGARALLVPISAFVFVLCSDELYYTRKPAACQSIYFSTPFIGKVKCIHHTAPGLAAKAGGPYTIMVYRHDFSKE